MKNIKNGGLFALGFVLILAGAAFHFSGRGDPAPEPVSVATGGASSLEPGAAVETGAAVTAVEPRTDIPVMQVWKSPTCGCCNGWIDHLRAEGFRVETHDVQNMAEVKAEHGVPSALGSCHTAIIGDYVVEGHVPAGDILRLLAEEPAVTGLAVPGMPIGSPGMEYGDEKEPYQTMAFQRDGGSTVWASH